MPKLLPNPNGTVNEMISASVAAEPSRPALMAKIDKQWKPLTYADLGDKLRAFSLGLRSLGVKQGDRVAIISENRPEWAITDLATLAMGAITVPIYPTLPPAQVAHILSDSGAVAIIASDAKQLKKVIEARQSAPELKHMVIMDGDAKSEDAMPFDQVIQRGREAEPSLSPPFDELRKSVKSSDLASLVYTSGTTGNPKGAMLSHGNFYSAAQAAFEMLPFDLSKDVFLSFLPLCHVFERVTYYLALGMGVTTYYTESIFKVQENMAEVHPTLMQSVPRLYEAIHERVMDTAAKAPAKRQKIFHWAVGVGTESARRRNSGRMVSPVLAVQLAIADRLVLSKIRERLGGNWSFFVSGGAPLAKDPAEFFQGVGIPVVEGYGLTETTAAVCVNPVGRAKVGSVGKPMPKVKVKLAGDGEILVTGPTVMSGYWQHPDATADVIDNDGWFHTGDIGVIDSDGYLKITDRKKDIIVLANGKNVAPQPIENHLKSASLIAEVVLLGDKSETISALVVPNFDKLADWAKKSNVAFEKAVDLAGNTDARRAIKQQIDELSGNLAEFEKIRRIALLDHPLTIDAGELTPTLKVRRKVVQERYGKLLD